jgi:hypothetical protein
MCAKAMAALPPMDFVQRFQALQLQRNTSNEIIKVGHAGKVVRAETFGWHRDITLGSIDIL